MTPALLLIGHGSRDPRFADTVGRVRAAVAQRLPGVAVDSAYLELNAPLVADAVAGTGPETVVVPLLLAPGYHSEIDLPGIIAAAGSAPRIADVVGRCSLVSALADRLAEAGLRDDDGVLVTAVGSSDPAAARVVERRAAELAGRLDRPVEVVYATRLGEDAERLREAVARLHAAGARRIALSPYFLSAGLLTERVETALDRIAPGSLVAGPIGTHPRLIDAVTGAYRGALDRPLATL